MAMSRRKDRARTPGLWIATNALPVTGGHPFYQRLNQVLDTHAFDACVEAQCAPFYAATVGRPSLLPGTYYRLLLIGDVEGIDSERGIAWRPADSLALRGVLGLDLDEAPPEHSTISRTRRLIDLETHRAVFTWILQVLATTDLVTGQTIGIDATTLEANAALRSSVRRDSGETSQEFLTRLAQASGIETPTRADLARVDRKRPKKGRNTDWRHPHDPDARITKMKDGRTHLAHKAEHAVDLETGAIVGVTVQGADQGDTTTIAETVTAAAEELEAVAVVTDGQTAVIDEVVADKGYHSNQVLVDLGALDLRTYIAEPNRGRRNWKKKTVARDAVYAHRRRIRGARGLAWQRRRSEHLERPNAHLYETGGLRRPHVRGHANILKRLLIQTSAFNVGLLMRTLIGVGTPRGLQGRLAAVWALVVALWTRVVDLWRHDHTPSGDHAPAGTPHHRFELFPVRAAEWALSPRAASRCCGSLKHPDVIACVHRDRHGISREVRPGVLIRQRFRPRGMSSNTGTPSSSGAPATDPGRSIESGSSPAQPSATRPDTRMPPMRQDHLCMLNLPAVSSPAAGTSQFGSAKTKRLFPALGRSSGVNRMLSLELIDVPVLTTTYCRSSTA